MFEIKTGTDALIAALYQTWSGVFSAIPMILAAIIFLIIGLLVARSFEFVIERTIKAIKLDSLLTKMGFDRLLERGGMKLNSGKFIGRLTWWIMVFVFITVIADILGVATLSEFIRSALGWVFTKLIAAALIVFAAAVIAQFLKKIVNAAIAGTKLHSAFFLSGLVFWSVMVFGFIAALKQIGIDTALIDQALLSFIMVVPISVGLALGLSFGLGGKEHAKDILDKLMHKLEK